MISDFFVPLTTSQIMILPVSKPVARIVDFTTENFIHVTCYKVSGILLTLGSANDIKVLVSPIPVTQIEPSIEAEAKN